MDFVIPVIWYNLFNQHLLDSSHADFQIKDHIWSANMSALCVLYPWQPEEIFFQCREIQCSCGKTLERGEGALEWDLAQQPGPTFMWVTLMTSSQKSEGGKDSSKDSSLYFIVWIKSIGLNKWEICLDLRWHWRFWTLQQSCFGRFCSAVVVLVCSGEEPTSAGSLTWFWQCARKGGNQSGTFIRVYHPSMCMLVCWGF